MSPDLLSNVINAVPAPTLVIGPAQTIVASNPAARALLGDHVAGRHYITALRQPSLLEQIEVVLRDRGTAHGVYLGRDGARDTNFTVNIAAADVYTILTFEDRTAAEDVGQFRRDFVANVSHELRTPLTALLGFIETLRGAARNDPKAQDRFLAIMEREAGRMTRLVDDLLSLSRLEANERRKPDTPVVLADVISSTITELSPVLDGAETTVLFDDQSDQIAVPAAAEELRQVIGNLIENAVKYGPKGGGIIVRLGGAQHEPSLRGQGVRLTVADRGQGIAHHHIARLTERFYRVDDHRSREVGGTGLGLAIVKHIVNRHRGRLQIESTLGEGTTVTVILPTD